MLPPLTQFCCGCSISSGAYTITTWHLIASLLYIACAICNLIFQTPTYTSHWSYGGQMCYTILCMVGIPVIIGAMWGIYKKVEAAIRLYLYYFMVCFVVDVVLLCTEFLGSRATNCQDSGSFIGALNLQFGEAYMCGAFHILSYICVAGIICAQAYSLWLIHSVLEEVEQGYATNEFGELLANKEAALMKLRRAGKTAPGMMESGSAAYGGIDGGYGFGVDGVEYNVPSVSVKGGSFGLFGLLGNLKLIGLDFGLEADERYGNIGSKEGGFSGLSDANLPGPYGNFTPQCELGIFGGTSHDTSYPPKR